MPLILESAIGLSIQINFWTTLASNYVIVTSLVSLVNQSQHYLTSKPSATASAKFSSTMLAQWLQMVAL